MKPQPEFSEAEVVSALELLIPTPERDPQTAQRTRTAFLEQASILRPPVTVGPIYRLKLWIASLSKLSVSPVLRPLTIAIATLVIVFAGSGVTTAAAQAALPGDRLYPLKLLVEETRLQLTSDPDKDFTLHIQFAYERVDEFQKLAELGREADARLAQEGFQTHYTEAREEAAVLNAAQIEALDAVYAAYLAVIGEPEDTYDEQPEPTEENQPVIPVEDIIEEEAVPVETQPWHSEKITDGAEADDDGGGDDGQSGTQPAEDDSELVEAEEDDQEVDDIEDEDEDEPESEDEDRQEADDSEDDKSGDDEPDSEDDDSEEKEDDEKDESDADDDREEDD